MDGITRLNRDATGRVPVLLGEETAIVEVLNWAYSPALIDNVPHRHTFYEVCLVGRQGSGVFTAGGIPYALTPGDLFFARPGVLHRIQNTGERLMELAWVSFALLPHGASPLYSLTQFGKSETVTLRPGTAHGMLPLWYDALPALAANPSVVRETMASVAAALLTGIIHAGTETTTESFPTNAQHPLPDTRVATIAVRYIHDNLNRSISVSEVAAQVHVSPRHLTRLILAFTGVAPAAYIERTRLDRAATMLTRTQTAIKAIAETVGYGSVHHFTRAFARVQGVSPGAFRASGTDPIRRGADTEPEGALV